MLQELDLSVVIVNWNTHELLAECLRSVYETEEGLGLEVIVVDNASTDGSVEMVRRLFPQVKLLANGENVGFVRANNQAFAHCRARYVLMLNSDTRVLPGSLQKAVGLLNERPGAGIVGVRLLNPDGSFQASYTPFPTLWREFLMLSGLGRWLICPFFPSCGPQIAAGAQRIVGYMEGAFLMARREAMDDVGGLDERIFMYAEEVDWCYRFHQAGWELWYLPGASIIHYSGQSAKRQRRRMESELYRSRVFFFRKHHGRLSALHLKGMIYVLTGAKVLVHRGMRVLTGGRRGRLVPGLRELHSTFRRVP